MTQEEKQLLLKDLCARLPYGVNVKTTGDNESYILLSINSNKNIALIGLDFDGVYATSKIKIDDVKPYLRPMSSMTDEERKEYEGFIIHRDHIYAQGQEWDIDCFSFGSVPRLIDWFNAHHFDYRGLIEKGLAIKVTKENNPYEN